MIGVCNRGIKAFGGFLDSTAAEMDTETSFAIGVTAQESIRATESTRLLNILT